MSRPLPRYLPDPEPGKLERIVAAEAQEPLIVRGTAGGDERKLRGIPAIGRGVAGAIPGSVPHALRAAS